MSNIRKKELVVAGLVVCFSLVMSAFYVLIALWIHMLISDPIKSIIVIAILFPTPWIITLGNRVMDILLADRR
jgi:uncharacterized protein (DUF983 family)